jgi:hypothetical protein
LNIRTHIPKLQDAIRDARKDCSLSNDDYLAQEVNEATKKMPKAVDEKEGTISHVASCSSNLQLERLMV